MRTSGEIDFRFRLKLKITLVESTYPSQRPQCPSLSPHFLLVTVDDGGNYLTIRPVARKGYGSIAHEAKPNGLLTRGP